MSNYLFYFIKCHLFDIGPFKFNISRCKARQWCEDFRSSEQHVTIVVDHSEESCNCFLFLGRAMFCNASTFLGRGWIPSRVIQYPRYLISNLAKCDLLALTLSPASLSCNKTFSSHSRCFSDVEHDVTSKSLMYAWTYSKSKKSSNMHSWKMSGLLQRPIGRHWYSYLPQGVTIVIVFY